MGSRRRILFLSLLLGLSAVPLTWAAGSAANACCSEAATPTPCGSQAQACPSLAPTTCCEPPSAAGAPLLLGSAHGQTGQAVVASAALVPEPERGPTRELASADLSACASPLRFSVVLRI